MKEFDIGIAKKMYQFENKTAKEIGEYFGISTSTAMRRLKKHGVVKKYDDKEWLKKKHIDENLTAAEIARLISCENRTISSRLKKFNIKQSDSAKKSRKNTYDSTFFKSIDTPEKAYWLGFTMADGSLTNKSGQHRLRFQLKREDRYHLEQFSYTIAQGLAIQDGETFDNRTNKTYYYSVLKVYSKEICNDLIELGMVPSNKHLSTNPIISNNLQSHFVRGVFDADGSFSYYYSKTGNPTPEFNLVGNHDMIHYISHIFENHLNITPRIKFERNMYMFYLGGGIQVPRIMEWLYDESNIHLKRKYKKFQEYLSLKSKRQ